MKDRRKHERVEMVAEVQIPHDEVIEILFARDLSEGGVFLAAAPDDSPWLLPGVPVDLALSVAVEDAHLIVRARGRVVWRQDASSGRTPGIGVAFEELDPESLRVLRRALAT